MTAKFGAKSTADDVLSDVDLTGRRFLITGASSGIGLETARALVARGAHVVGTARNLAKAETAASALDIAPGIGEFEWIELDLASLRSVLWARSEELISQLS
ncbi:SDR family NAD(P)-dependent oxidoreductase [Mycolicibacterium litorale]|uniref:SDR family NAD(P)-dependent oxidoreductase n=1 Tax=Mycolicibacterium litorale TaxID=758802 RepID=UPI003CF4E7B3